MRERSSKGNIISNNFIPMVKSNILSIFTGRESSDINVPIDDGSDCLPCLTIQSLTSIGLGCYLNSNRIFMEGGKIDVNKSPIIWQRSVKAGGLLLIGFGVYRMSELQKWFRNT